MERKQQCSLQKREERLKKETDGGRGREEEMGVDRKNKPEGGGRILRSSILATQRGNISLKS